MTGNVPQQKSFKPVKEGDVGTFGDLQKKSILGDNLDIHHIPNDHYNKGKLGITRNEGVAIAVPRTTHRVIHKTLPKQDIALAPRDALAESVKTSRKVYADQGKTSEIRPSLQKVIKQNKETFPEHYNKKGTK